jgi:hypothetical protein
MGVRTFKGCAMDQHDEQVNDEVIDETITTDWSAQECADELNIGAKAFRAAMRAYSRANGLAMPGAGGEWAIPVPVDDAERAAFFDWMRTDVVRAGATKRVVKFGRAID